ncbi:MAG: ABC transporter substrate-binding protein [Promethearchaeota archaeon]
MPIEDNSNLFNDNYPEINQGVEVIEFRYGLFGNIYDLDPHMAWDSSSIEVIEQVCEGLFKYNLSDPENSIIPNLASSLGVWSIDNKNYTIPLKTGIKFHDDNIFNAFAVKWSFDRLKYFMNVSGTLPLSKQVTQIDSVYRFHDSTPIINRVEIINDYKIRFILNRPYSAFAGLLCFLGSYILSPYSTPNFNYIDTNTGDLVGTGPFIYDAYNIGSSVNFHAFEDYWQGKAKIQNLVFSIYQNLNDLNQALFFGDIDLLTTPSYDYINTFETDPTIILVEGKNVVTWNIHMNNIRISKALRQAISYAIDYSYINEVIMKDRVVRLRSPIPEGVLFANWSFNVATLNVANARQILLDNGVVSGLDPFVDTDWTNLVDFGTPIKSYTYTYPIGSSFRENLCNLLSENMRQIGIQIIADGIDWNEYLNRVFYAPNELELFDLGWGPEYNDPSQFIDPLFSNTSLYNFAQVNDIYLQNLMELGLEEPDLIAREAIYDEIQRYVVEDLMPSVFLYQTKNLDAYKSYVLGFQSNPFGKLWLYNISILDSDGDGLSDRDEIKIFSTDPNDPDSDDDGLNDGEEVNTYFTNPNDSDSDDDGLSDGEEVNMHSTDPNDPDTDSDMMPDGWEVLNGLNPLIDDSSNDPDSDNLSNLEEYTHSTDPNDHDSDDDGLNDGEEVNTYFTDPNDPDSDDDNLTDDEEVNSYSTDPNDPDSDDDGLSDGIEVNTHSTDPNDYDSDDDGLNDGEEVNAYSTDPNDSDSDNDQISDGDEVNVYGTNPNNRDSDADGFSDYDEIFNHHTDPNNFFSSPLTIPVTIGIISSLVFIGFVVFMATIGKRKIRDMLYTIKVKKETIKRKEEELSDQILQIENLIETKEYSKALEDYERIINKAKKYHSNYILKIAKKKLKYCKILQKEHIKDLEAKTFEGLIKKAIELVKAGKKSYSKQSYNEALENWNNSLETYNQAIRNATTPDNKSKIKEILKTQNVIQNDIVNTYIENGKAHESLAQEKYKKNQFSEVLKNLEIAKLEYQSAINFINTHNLKEEVKFFKEKINSVDFKIEKIKLKQEINEIDKVVEKAHIIQDEELTEAKKIIDDSLIKYKNISKAVEFYPDLISELENRINIANKYKVKLEDKLLSLIQISPSTKSTRIEMVQEPDYGKLLNAKIVFIGPTGVGKTSLIRYIMGKEFSLYEPSTTGLDIFYKKIETTIKDYETQFCFWDLSGQPNLSTFNEINIHDANVIVLVFDITNPPTFKELKKTYLGFVKKARKLERNFVFLVGNKIDLGGRAITKKEIDQFVVRNNIHKSFETSASTGENMEDFLGSIRQAIDWSELVKNVKPEILNIIGKEIKKLRTYEKIMEMSEFISIFVEQIYQMNKVDVQATLKQYASQDLILLGGTGRYIVLDPEFIAKNESELSKMAAYNNGRVNRDEYLKKWKLTRTQLKMLFKFFEEENYCYRLSKRIWVFSNVPRDIETKIDEYDQEILDSDTHSTAYKIFGTSEFTFNRLVANLAKEFGAPENGGGFFGVNSALWRIGRIPELNILFINYMPSEEGGVIRFKIGGGKGANLFKKVDELAFQVFTAYAPEFEKLKVIEEYS